MYLIFDTETTGFPSKDLPANHPNQARIVQLAALLLDDKFEERGSIYCLIQPTNWVISQGAFQQHGITIEECKKYGVELNHAIYLFCQLLNNAEVLIAHNIKFDSQLLDIEFINAGIVSKDYSQFCTMEATTDICKIPSKRGGYKWPKLSEAYKHLLGEELIGGHDALVDVRACAKIFKHLKWLENPVVT